MKKILLSLACASFACGLFAMPNPKDKVLTEEQLAKTQEASPKKLAVRVKKPRNILVFSRTDGYRHTEGIPAFNALMENMVKASNKMWKVTYTEDPKAFEAENLKKYDCIIFNNSTGKFFCEDKETRKKMTPEESKADDERNVKYRENLLEYVKNGGGVMGMHAACDAQGNSEYVDMMGGLFAGHPWNAGNKAVTVCIEDPNNALVKGIWKNREFQIQDEIYTFRDDRGFNRDKQRVLMSLVFEKSPLDNGEDPMKRTSRKEKDFGLVWVKEFGKGRVFYGAFGHRIDIYWRNPEVCEMYMRGIQYACGDLQTQTKPLSKLKPAQASK